MTHYIKRTQVKTILDRIAASPWRVFTAQIKRRGDLFLRYGPRDMTTNGAFARDGDHSRLDADHGSTIIHGPDGERYDLTSKASNRRPGKKVLLQAAGTDRWVSCKN